MRVTVKYFASIREAVGRGSETLETGAADIAALRDELTRRGGAYAESLARGKSVRAAVNQVMVDESSPVSDGCEVAFFPPVTGG